MLDIGLVGNRGDFAGECFLGISVDREGNFLIQFDFADVRFVHQGLNLHFVQIGDRQQHHRVGYPRRYRLARRNRLADHHTGDRSLDHRVLQVGCGIVVRCLGHFVIGARGVQLLSGIAASLRHFAGPLIVGFRIGQFGAGLGELSPVFGVIQHNQHIIGFDILVFDHFHFRDQAGDFRTDIDVVHRRNRAGRRHHGDDVALLHFDLTSGRLWFVLRLIIAVSVIAAHTSRNQKNQQPLESFQDVQDICHERTPPNVSLVSSLVYRVSLKHL